MRLRFTIRDLLWLTVVVAVCVAWWIEHRRMDGQAMAAKKEIEHQKQLAAEYKRKFETLEKQFSERELDRILRLSKERRN